MSTAKRSRRRQSEARAASPLPASKRIKTTKTSHVPAESAGLGFLVDEDARSGKKLEANLTNGVPSSKTTRVDESHAVVAPDTRDQYEETDQVGVSHENAIGISSGEEESEDDEDGDENEDGEEAMDIEPASSKLAVERPLTNGHLPDAEDHDEQDVKAGAEDVDVAESDAEREDEEEREEPSFGDMLQARHPDPIDVQASFPNPMADRQALIPASGDRVLTAPSGTSLGTVLTQALKTNDKDLLESCFQTTDLPSIRSTIQRLQSQHVATLLQRLAERIHKRPGRAGNLMVWVQWSLVAHGGYLASQPEVMKKLKSLSQVIRERANGLQPLLHLKGKLDMLSAQLELRRNMQAVSRAANAEDDEDEEGVVYVEGQEEDWSDSEDAAQESRMESTMLEPPVSKPKPQTATPRTDEFGSEDDSSSDEDMPNGVAQQVDDSEADEDEAEEGMFDVEAEETSDDDSAEAEDSDEASNSDSESEPDSEPDSEPSDGESDTSGIQPAQPSRLHRKR